MAEEMKERNNTIVYMRKKGYTLRELAIRFGVSMSRIEQICKREDSRERLSEEYKDFDGLPGRARNALLRAGIESKEDVAKALEEGWLVHRRWIGEKTIKELEGLIGQGNLRGTYDND